MTTLQPIESSIGSPRVRGIRTDPPIAAPRSVPSSRRTLLGYLLVPRPKDLFKALLMPLTFGLAALAAGGVSAHTVLRAVIVLSALELLVYPARYQWNDVRGFAADQRHPAEADRGRLPGPLDRARPHIAASCLVAVARLVVVAALPFLLPGLHLGGLVVWMVAGVFGVAIAYEGLRAVATGRTGAVPPPARPALVLIWIIVGAGYVVRGLTGLALVVDLPRHPAIAVVAGVTLWAYGVSFVTSRWAIESTAFARLHRDRIDWTADAGQAREHLLALVRWLPARADARHLSGRADGAASGWAALRGRTSVLAPWNMAAVIAGAAAALTGRWLAGPASVREELVVTFMGGLAALAVVVAPRGRGLVVAVGAAILLGVLLLVGAPASASALLPWLAVMTAYARFSSGCLRTMGALGDRLRVRLSALLAPLARTALGRDTWEALMRQDSARA
jgi:hypothetical protein